MNERIKELAKQAGMTDDKFGMYFAKDKHNEDGVDLEKFAQLIVAECADLAEAEIARMREDAERYHFLRDDFSVSSPNIDGNHSWAYRRNFSLKGPTLDAAIDAARKNTK